MTPPDPEPTEKTAIERALPFAPGVVLLMFAWSLTRHLEPPELRTQARNSAILYSLLLAVFPWIVMNARRRWPQMLLALTSMLLVLLCSEVFLRVAFPLASRTKFAGVSSTKYHHYHRKNVRANAGATEEGLFLINNNEDGLRTDYTRKDFLAHKTRIAVLGDSFTFGWRVVGEHAVPARLEARLREKLGTTDLAVLNAGVVSFSPFLEKLLFEGIVKDYKPTLTILFLDATDIGDDNEYEREYNLDDPNHRPPKPAGQFYDRRNDGKGYYGAAYKLIIDPAIVTPFMFPWERYVLPVRNNWAPMPVLIDGKEENRFFIYRQPRSVTNPYFDRTWRNVRDVAKAVRAAGSEFVFVVAPRFQHWNTKECPYNWEEAAKLYSREEPYQFEYLNYFDEHRGEADFKVKNLLPDFKATTEFPLVIVSDPHWTALGHDFVARVTADYLIQEKLLP